MSWIGLDIGGANIKVAYADGSAKSVEYALWKNKDGLKSKLDELLGELTSHYRLAVTMTGELADCFESKKIGVQHIVDSCCSVSHVGPPVFYQTNGKFVPGKEAVGTWQKTAASNWHALATFASRFMPGNSGIVIDIGSTTTDIIPVKRGEPCSGAKTDTSRLQSNELVYSGILRSPINGLLDTVTIGGKTTPVANEIFATTLDAHVYLKNIPQSSNGKSTADGRPANIEFSAKRLARMVCADGEEITENDVRAIAEATVAAQVKLLAGAIQTVAINFPELESCMLISGAGNWLAQRIIREHFFATEVLEIDKLVSAPISTCAPAVAVAWLAENSNVRSG